ncbi:MAG: hypothetical protein J6T94_12365 [Bacteroidaceae bacterium]|nr:hypothetical protein [Bacteroidaceae bacterium]
MKKGKIFLDKEKMPFPYTFFIIIKERQLSGKKVMLQAASSSRNNTFRHREDKRPPLLAFLKL